MSLFLLFKARSMWKHSALLEMWMIFLCTRIQKNGYLGESCLSWIWSRKCRKIQKCEKDEIVVLFLGFTCIGITTERVFCILIFIIFLSYLNQVAETRQEMHLIWYILHEFNSFCIVVSDAFSIIYFSLFPQAHINGNLKNNNVVDERFHHAFDPRNMFIPSISHLMLKKERELYACVCSLKSEKSTILQWRWWRNDGPWRSFKILHLKGQPCYNASSLLFLSGTLNLTFSHLFGILPCVKRSKKLLVRLE